MKRAGKIEKVMLLSPRYTLFKNDVRRCVSPMGLAYLAAFLEKQGYEIKILDIAMEGYDQITQDGNFITYGLEDSEIQERIADFNPDVVGASCLFSTQAKNTKHALRLAKELNKDQITLTGGAHSTFALEEMLAEDCVDFVIRGEGELPTANLLNALRDNESTDNIAGVNQGMDYSPDVNELPFPARHLLDMEKYFQINMPQNPYPEGKRVTQLITSRGCPQKCIFCTTTNFWGHQYRPRSAENVIAEMRQLKQNYKIDEIQFTDDNLTLNKKRTMEILEGMAPLNLKWCVPQGVFIKSLDDEILEKMREVGCYQLTFATESGNQQVLDNIVNKPLDLKIVKPLLKKAQSLGILVHSFNVIGLPGETLDQMQETYDFVKDCGFDSASFFAATPLIGSRLMDICKDEGYLRDGMKENEQLYKVGNINTPEFRAEQVQELAEQFNMDYNAGDSRLCKPEDGKY